MAEKDNNKDNQNNQNNPFGRFNPNKKTDGKPPKFNAYWFYGIIAVVFLIVNFLISFEDCLTSSLEIFLESKLIFKVFNSSILFSRLDFIFGLKKSVGLGEP